MIRKVFGVAMALTAILAFQLVATAADMTADEIIAKHFTARGGLDKIKAVSTVKMTAKIMNHGMEVPGNMELKRPNMIRMEFTVQGQNIVQAFDGETGWMIMPLMGVKDPQKMPDEDVKEIKEQADFDGPLVDYKTKGNTVELMGKEPVEGTDAYKIKVTLKSGDVRYIYIDADSFLELKTTSMIKREGNDIQVDSYSGDYKEVKGLMLPFSIETKVKDQTVSQITIETIDMGVPLDDSMFKMPAVAQTQTAPTK